MKPRCNSQHDHHDAKTKNPHWWQSSAVWSLSGWRDEADVRRLAQNKGAAQRRGGRSQAEGRVAGLKRVPPLAASAERGARSRRRVPAGVLSRATGGRWALGGRRCRGGNLYGHGGRLWSAGRTPATGVERANQPLQHVLGALSALRGGEQIEKSRDRKGGFGRGGGQTSPVCVRNGWGAI